MDHFSSPQKHFLENNFISKNIFHHHRTFNLNYLNFENFFFFSHRTFIFQKLCSLYLTFLTTLSYLLCIIFSITAAYTSTFNFFFYPLLYQFPYLNCSYFYHNVSFPTSLKLFLIASQLLKFSSLNTILSPPLQP